MEIGVRELKSRLSEILERASAGETIRVVSRGRPKAVIGPIPPEERIEQGIREGWIRGPTRPGRPVIPAKRYRSKMTIAESLHEDRGE